MKHANLISLTIGALLMCGPLQAVQAAPIVTAEISQVTELQDGSLSAYSSMPTAQTPVHYSRQPQLLASGCVSLQTRHRASAVVEPTLVNHCDYAVAVSYCVEDGEAGARACDAVGHRKVEIQHIEAGASLKLAERAAMESEVNWVACRAESGIATSLTDGGTQGECLVADPEPVAERTAAAGSN